MEKITLQGICKRLPVFTLLLIAINLLAVFIADLTTIRITRLLSIAFFLAYYWSSSSQKYGMSFWILTVLLIRDVALIFYETKTGHGLYLILGIASYICICVSRLDMIKTILNTLNSLVFTLILIALNTFALSEVTAMVQQTFQGPFEPYLFYIYGALMILMAATAIIYNHVYNSDRSLIYVFFVICFLMSDVTSLFAYYFEFEVLFYIDKMAFILGLGLFTYTVLETNREVEETEQYTMLSWHK